MNLYDMWVGRSESLSSCKRMLVTRCRPSLLSYYWLVSGRAIPSGITMPVPV